MPASENSFKATDGAPSEAIHRSGNDVSDFGARGTKQLLKLSLIAQ